MEDHPKTQVHRQYNEVRRDRPKLPVWDELDDDFVFAFLETYDAGVRDGWSAARQPEQSSKVQDGVRDALSCPMGTTPQRDALFRRMFNAVIHELVPASGVEDDMFKGIHQHTARMAIADLAVALLPFAIDDVDHLDNSIWTSLVDEIRDEMRAIVLAEEGDVPFPTCH
jgi:hypothetical protein